MLVCDQRLDGLDQGDFTEGRKLDRKGLVPKQMIGRRLPLRKQSGCWVSSTGEQHSD
jgi:hypothetical protein